MSENTADVWLTTTHGLCGGIEAVCPYSAGDSKIAGIHDLAAVAAAQRGECRNAHRVVKELHVSIGEQAVDATGVKAERLIVVSLVDCEGGNRRPAAFDGAVGVGTIEAERSFVVGPADALIVRQSRLRRAASIHCRPAGTLDDADGVRRPVTHVRHFDYAVPEHDGCARLRGA